MIHIARRVWSESLFLSTDIKISMFHLASDIEMYLCVRQMTVIIENTTPMARPRSTLRTTTDSQVTTQTIYIKKHSTVMLTLSCQDNTSATVTSIMPDQWVPLQSPSCWFSTAQVSPGTAKTSAWGWWHWCMPVLPGREIKDEMSTLFSSGFYSDTHIPLTHLW